MRSCFLILITLVAVIGSATPPQLLGTPLSESQLIDRVKACTEKVKPARPTIKRGIDFLAGDDFFKSMRGADANEVLISALSGASNVTKGELVVVTSPNAEVYLDGELVGRTNPDGEVTVTVKLGTHTLKVTHADKKDFVRTFTLTSANAVRMEVKLEDVTGTIRVETIVGASIFLDGAAPESADFNGVLVMDFISPGEHQLRISAPGKKDFQKSLVVESGQVTRVEARLEEATGSVRVKTLAGASISLDGASPASTDKNGELVLGDVPPGAHQLHLSAPGKKDFQQSLMVEAGQETLVQATLQDASPPPGQVRLNPKDGLKYVWIPSGTFMMGCSPDDTECYDEERPSHRVTLSKGFWIGQTEVTLAAYKRFADATGKQMPPLKPAWSQVNAPMMNVIWNDAQAYCQWAGGRLLTEAEWEYAARGGSTSARYGPIDDIAWYAKNSGGQPHEVGLKRANGFGLFDMLGNEWEWVNDWFDQTYYKTSPPQDPPGPVTGKARVSRGGSWDIVPRVVRVSLRSESNPDVPRTGGNLGIRCGGDLFAP
jgi:formylglycine-generating enzyme required for sulfatase activity